MILVNVIILNEYFSRSYTMPIIMSASVAKKRHLHLILTGRIIKLYICSLQAK